MANKALNQTFNADWNKAIAFAQLHGIGANDIIPIYQKDAQQMANYGTPMSMAERNRALLAAKNPNNVTPVPSDKPNPVSFLGNARTDLGNIFTGLAPNHLIPDIFKTAETAIAHPSSWLRPIEDVGKGVLTGNVKDIKQGLEAAASPNSILALAVPGVSVLGELASGGIDEVLSHPVSSFLDVAPFAPVGRVLSVALDSDRMISVANSLHMDVNDLYNASAPQLGAKFLMSREVTGFDDEGKPIPLLPGVGKLTNDVLTYPVIDKTTGRTTGYRPLTLSDLFRRFGQTHGGDIRASAVMASSAFDLRNYATTADIYTTKLMETALQKIQGDPEKMKQFELLTSPNIPHAPGQMPADIMANSDIDQDVRDAVNAKNDDLDITRSRAMASGGLLPMQGPTFILKDGSKMTQTDYIGVQGGPNSLVTTSRVSKRSTNNLLRVLKPAADINKKIDEMAPVGSMLEGQLDQLRQQSMDADVQGSTERRVASTDKDGKPKTFTSLPLDKQRDLVMAEDGLIGRALDAMSDRSPDGPGTKDPDYVAAREYLAQAEHDLTHNGYGRLKVDDPRLVNPAFEETLNKVRQLKDWTTQRVKLERQFDDKFLGGKPEKGKRFTQAQESLVPKKIKGVRKNLLSKNPEIQAAERRRIQVREGERMAVQKALSRAVRDYRAFQAEWWANAADKWRSVLYDHLTESLLDKSDKSDKLEDMSQRIRDLGLGEKYVQALHSDPKILAQAIYHEFSLANQSLDHMPILDDEEMLSMVRDAVDYVQNLRMQGYNVEYVPVISTLSMAEKDPGRYGAGVAYHGKVRELASTKGRNMTEFMPERYDLLAAVHTNVRDAIQRDITIEFANEHIRPASLNAKQVSDWATRAFPDETFGYDPLRQNKEDVMATSTARRLGLRKWDPMLHMGFSFPQWGTDAVYIPEGLANSVEKLLEKDHFALDGVYDKATDLFRFSILGLSPRYTAHIVFGGAFLLTLRSSHHLLAPSNLRQAYQWVKEGEVPREVAQGATERGGEFIKYQSMQPLEAGLSKHAEASGTQLGNMAIQGELGRQGIDWTKANPLQWLKAAGEVNYRFTNAVSSFYRSLAMLDGADKAAGSTFLDPDTGAAIKMTPERAKAEGVKHALKTMGNLKAMSAFERTTFMRIMPFYGWTRHILDYVLTYPVDHPYRAQFLSVAADQDSDSVAKALDTRMQFLFFLGSPDSQGNVKSVDVRFLDPLRDTANYASLAGWIGALNPVLSAPLAAIDPNLVYGSTSLYPSVTYNEFYGIETSTPSGNPLTAVAQQIVPQVGALDAAMSLAGNYRSLATKNPNQFYKTIFESLNIPFAQVQNINVKQLAAKGEIARYHVASAAATAAWQAQGNQGSGIEKALAGYASVPNPINPDYEITPAQLQAIYNAALAAYPGQNPSDVVVEPPTPSPAYTP